MRLVCVVVLAAATAGAILSVGQAAGQSPQVQEASEPSAQQSAELNAVAVLVAAETAVQQAIERAAPSVVAIGRFRKNLGGRRAALDAFNLNVPGIQFPLATMMVDEQLPTEFGSGVIISEDGLILTCYHVIDDPTENDYYVWLGQSASGESAVAMPLSAEVVHVPATVKAGDPWTDLAVLKVQRTQLPAMPMGDATELKRGSFVISLGNPYATARDGQASVSWGLVSNLQRRAPRIRENSSEFNPAESLQEFGTLIQTDAKLNLGTSGGALINLRGEMVGLTTSLAAVAGFEQSAGYAIPIDKPALRTISQLSDGKAPAFGFLGVEPLDAGGGRGALVRRVVPGLAGDNAGLRAGDTILEVDGDRIEDAEGLFREMSRREADTNVQITVYSQSAGRTKQLTARLGKKRLALARPGYSQNPEPSWRGLFVDFASALPPNRLMISSVRSDAAVLRVDPDSPAWNAGLRPGQLILEVDDKTISRPEEFYSLVEGVGRAVVMKTWAPSDGLRQVRVEPFETQKDSTDDQP